MSNGNALIGYTGFVGGTLLKQTDFKFLYRSTNIQEIRDHQFDVVVCAGVSAKKWIANQNPEADLVAINSLIDHLRTIACKTFVLISTVDVFKNPLHVDENSEINENDLQAYGKNRRHLEKFVEKHFPHSLIVRLPGLVGEGLRKNIIFDFLNNNNIQNIESRSVFQFYPMANLWKDIEIALANDLKLIHLTAEPISVADVSKLGFGKPFENTLSNEPARYDMQTAHAKYFGKSARYQYSTADTAQAIRNYAESEPKINSAK